MLTYSADGQVTDVRVKIVHFQKFYQNLNSPQYVYHLSLFTRFSKIQHIVPGLISESLSIDTINEHHGSTPLAQGYQSKEYRAIA